MPLPDEFPDAVKLILRTRLREGELVQGIAGTGFVVSMESKTFGSALRHRYLVTAAHVVSGAHEVHARLRLLDGTTDDALITNWVRLDDYDVAVAPFPDREDLYGASVSVDMFMYEAPYLGDSVFFIGLLRNMAAMEDSGVPMVRSGTVGRLWQEGIRATLGDLQTELTGHLIDCRAYEGMSGSPCFVQQSFPLIGVADGKPFMRHVTKFFGMIAAHFADSETAQRAADDSDSEPFRYKIHAGVGIVTPARFIREALDDEELVKLRREADRREAKRREAKRREAGL
jgi:hypothetical protein